MKTYAIDFETYYDSEFTLKKMSVDRYCAGLTPERILGVGIYGDNGRLKYAGDVRNAPWGALADARWISHNRSFDQRVWDRCRQLALVDPLQSGPSIWECTADLAAYLRCGRDLQTAAMVLLGETPDKDIRDAAKGHLMDTEAERLAYMLYCQEDARLCYRIWTKHHRAWPAWEREVSLLTHRASERGLRVNKAAVNRYIGEYRRRLEDLTDEIPWAGKRPPTSVLGRDEWVESFGFEAPESYADSKGSWATWRAQALDSGKRGVKRMLKALEASKEYNRVNLRLSMCEAILARRRPDGSICTHLKYAAAHTRRWGGSGGLNFQALPRDGAIRDVFMARPCKRLLAIDLASIEPRVLLWIAGDAEALARIAGGEDIYEAAARRYLGYKHPGKLKEVDPGLRQIAKMSELGCGYGLGVAGLRNQAAGFGIDLSEADCRKAVEGYRAGNPLVVDLWNGFTETIQAAVEQKGCGEFELVLPSGNTLLYEDVRETKTKPKKHRRTGKLVERSPYTGARTLRGVPTYSHLWHGSITENVVQATARDILADRMLALEKNGFDVLLTVHDEVIVEVPAEGAKELAARALGIMVTAPSWMLGIPLEAEIAGGGPVRKYSK